MEGPSFHDREIELDTAYEKLPILQAGAIDSKNFIIPPAKHRDNLHKDLFYSYLVLAMKNPDWIGDEESNLEFKKTFGSLSSTQLKQYFAYNQDRQIPGNQKGRMAKYYDAEIPYAWDDVFCRALELLSQDCPDLCIWRGGDYGMEGIDYLTMIDAAVVWIFSSAGEPRKRPVLIGVPLAQVVQEYKNNKNLLLGYQSSASDSALTIRGKGSKIYEDAVLSAKIFRPSDKSDKHSIDEFSKSVYAATGETELTKMVERANKQLNF